LSGSDSQGRPLTFAIASSPAHGTFSGLDAATGTLTYTPATGYVGADSFTFTVNNGIATSLAATVSISVQSSGGGGTAAPLNVLKLSARISFTTGGKDSMKASGSLTLPAGFSLGGQTVNLDVAGVTASGTTDPKGRIKSGNFTFSIKTTKSAPTAAKFTAMLKNGSWATTLAAAGCTNADAKNKSVSLKVTLTLGAGADEGTKSGSWTARAGKSGSLK
jgi:hypothetical protein